MPSPREIDPDRPWGHVEDPALARVQNFVRGIIWRFHLSNYEIRNQSELARKVGVPRSTISRIIAGDRIPGGDLIAKIEEAFGVEMWAVQAPDYNPERD